MFKNIKISTLILLLSPSLLTVIFTKQVKADCSNWHPHHCLQESTENTPFDLDTWNPVDWVNSGAGELCEANATVTAQRNIDREQGLHPIQKEYLRPYFGNLVDEVTVKWGSLLNDEWTFQGRTIQAGSAGQTYGNTIYIAERRQPRSTKQLILLAHEFRHVQQYRQRGNLDNFCREYMTAYAKAQFDYENNSFEREAYEFDYRFASELKNKIPSTYSHDYEFIHATPSWNQRSAVVLPTELPVKNVYFIHNNTVFYSETGTSHCAFLNPEPHAQHLRENSDYVELGNRNPLEFGNFTGQCAIQLKNVYFIHNNTVFYSATGTSHCAFLNPEPYAQHLRENSDYVELGNRNPLEFGNFTGQCAIQH